MSKLQKALDRLCRRRKDYTWLELEVVMTHFGYEILMGSGARRKFFHPERKVFVSLHKPHPRPFLKEYAIKIVIEHLKEEGFP